MSEEAKVEAVETVETEDPEAIFRELGEQERSAAEPDKKDGEGQGDTGTPEGQAEKATPAEDAEKPPASETTDIWKDAPEPLRKAYEVTEQARLKAENLAKAHGGRLAQAYQERDALNAKLAEVGKAAGPKTEKEGDESFEDYRKRMKDEFPDFARLFDKLDAAEAKVGQMEGSLESVQTRAAAAQTEGALEQQGLVFEQAHPEWEKEKSDPEIQKKLLAWAETQPRYVQDELRRNSREIVDGASAADLIARFKRETADPAKVELEERRKAQLEASRDAKVKGPAATKTGAAEGDIEGLWKELSAADERAARANGRR